MRPSKYERVLFVIKTSGAVAEIENPQDGRIIEDCAVIVDRYGL